MTRAFLLSSALLGACSVGEVQGPGGAGDASVGTADRTLCADKAATPGAAHQHSGGAGTRAGQGCMDAGCHGPVNRMGGEFAFAGTVYKQIAGTEAAPGVTVRIFKNGTNTSLSTVKTDAAGNFYVYKTPQFSLSEPQYETDVTACGSSSPILTMATKLTSAADGNCNRGGCHLIPGSNQAIYIP